MQAYHLAQQGAVWVDLAERGRLQLTGRDRTALLHRMSTNDLTSLSAGAGCLTVLTSPIGRIIDSIVYLNDGETVWAITGAGRGESIRAYCQRNIFFNDQVKIAEVSGETALIGLYGHTAGELAESLASGAAGLSPYGFVKTGELLIIRAESLAESAGYWLFGPSEAVKSAIEILQTHGATQSDLAAYNILRVEAGIPLANHELTDDYIPLEAGLWDAVSFSKGCYTGQEIIARMESRGKLAKMLMRLRSDSAVPLNTELYAGGGKVGTLTSLEAHPEGGFVGLGFIKSDAVQDQTNLTTEAGLIIEIVGIAGQQPRKN